MNEMVERVAKAIFNSSFVDKERAVVLAFIGTEEVTDDNAWTHCVPAARAAIEAVREPTLEMVRTGARAVNADQMIIQIPQDVWLAMIDAALKD